MDYQEFVQFWRLASDSDVDMMSLIFECISHPKVTPTYDSFLSKVRQTAPLTAAGIRSMFSEPYRKASGVKTGTSFARPVEQVKGSGAKVVKASKSGKIKESKGVTTTQRFLLAKKVTSVKPILVRAINQLAATYDGKGENKTLHSEGCTICAGFRNKGNVNGLLPKSLVKCVLAAHKTGLSLPSRADILTKLSNSRSKSPKIPTKVEKTAVNTVHLLGKQALARPSTVNDNVKVTAMDTEVPLSRRARRKAKEQKLEIAKARLEAESAILNEQKKTAIRASCNSAKTEESAAALRKRVVSLTDTLMGIRVKRKQLDRSRATIKKRKKKGSQPVKRKRTSHR